MLYGTYLKGTDASDNARGLAVDASGVAFVTGLTHSSDFPTTAGAYDTSLNGVDTSDAFLVKLNPAGGGSSDLLYGTYLGGTESESGDDLALDSDGKAYVVGRTYSSADFPLVDPTQASFGGGSCDASIFTLNPAGAGSADLEFSTYAGGDGVDIGFGIALDTADNIHITGYTLAADFPATTGAYGESYNGSWEAFVAKYCASSNTAPVIDDQSLPNVDENASNGTVVGTVSATEPDEDPLTYTITAGNTGNAFAINGTTGQVTVNNVAALDFETNPTFALTVEVTDTGALSDSATVTVNVTDVNEAPDVDAQIFITPETSEDGTIVGTVVASDPDAGDTLGYAITGGTGVGIFAVDPVTGEIAVLDASALDYESGTTSYTLQVEVSDDGAPALSDTATITIAVNDVAEGTGGGGAPQSSSSAAAAWAPTIARPTSALPAMSMPTLSGRIPLRPSGGRAPGEVSTDVAKAESSPGEPGGDDAAAAAEVASNTRAEDPADGQRDVAERPSGDAPVESVADAKPGQEDRRSDSPTARPRVADARPPSDGPDAVSSAVPPPEPSTDSVRGSWHERDITMSQVESLVAERPHYQRIAAGTACGLSAAMTAGYAIWCANGAFFARAALSSLPLWRWVDSVPVLEAWRGGAGRRIKRRKP